MSERCSLRTLTAALCCFYHRNAVISAKVRVKGGERACVRWEGSGCVVLFSRLPPLTVAAVAVPPAERDEGIGGEQPTMSDTVEETGSISES